MTALWLALKSAWAWARTPLGRGVLSAVAAVLAVWWWSGHEYRAGQAACEAAHTATAQTAALKQDRRNTTAVAASEARTTSDTKIEYRNKEIIRYVTRQAATLPGGGDVCIPADLADRVRGLQ